MEASFARINLKTAEFILEIPSVFRLPRGVFHTQVFAIWGQKCLKLQFIAINTKEPPCP